MKSREKFSCLEKCVLVSLLIVALVVGSSITSYASAMLRRSGASDISAPTTREENIKAQIYSTESSLDKAKVTQLAASSEQFKSATSGYDPTFNSIFDTWQTASDGCNIMWTSANVVFDLLKGNSRVGNVITTEDPSLTGVVSTRVENQTLYGGFSQSNSQWSGYSFLGDSSATTPVYETWSTWYIPGVAEPWTGACYSTCYLIIWNGLTHDASGSKIEQAGTLGQDTYICGRTCYDNHYYYLWYDLYPNTSVNCKIAATGDWVFADVYSQAEYGGDYHYYNIYIHDYTNGQICSLSNQYFDLGGLPYYGQFQGERASLCTSGCFARLARFSSFTFSGGNVYYSSSHNGIYTPYSNGWWIQWNMMNTCNGQTWQNIQNSGVDSGSDFTETWQNSNCT